MTESCPSSTPALKASRASSRVAIGQSHLGEDPAKPEAVQEAEREDEQQARGPESGETAFSTPT